MREPAQSHLLLYFSALTYLRSRVTHLNIVMRGWREERKRIIKAPSGCARFELSPDFWRRRGRKETRRSRDKGMKEQSIISCGAHQDEAAKQTEVSCSLSRVLSLPVLLPAFAPHISRLLTASEVWSIICGSKAECSRWRLYGTCLLNQALWFVHQRLLRRLPLLPHAWRY